MAEQNKASVPPPALVAATILCAIIARAFGVFGVYPKTMGIIRSVLYIGLFVAWGLLVRQRIIGTQACRYPTAAAALMVLWFVVRSLKYYYVTQPVVERYLWYFYYPSLILIPMLAALTAISIGKNDDAPLPESAALLYVPALLLVFMVLTNDRVPLSGERVGMVGQGLQLRHRLLCRCRLDVYMRIRSSADFEQKAQDSR